MLTHNHALLRTVNREVRNFLGRIDGLVRGTTEIGAGELRAIRRLLEAMGPDVQEASRYSSVDALLQAQLEAYADNLRRLEASLNQVRCVMLARRARMDAAQRHVDGIRGWINAYRQTAL
jgi:hypothetical protein